MLPGNNKPSSMFLFGRIFLHSKRTSPHHANHAKRKQKQEKSGKAEFETTKTSAKKPNPGVPWRRLVRCRRLCVGAWPWRRLRSVVLTKFELHVFCAPHVADHGEMFGVPGSAHCGKTCVFIQTTGTQVCLLSSCINNVFV